VGGPATHCPEVGDARYRYAENRRPSVVSTRDLGSARRRLGLPETRPVVALFGGSSVPASTIGHGGGWLTGEDGRPAIYHIVGLLTGGSTPSSVRSP